MFSAEGGALPPTQTQGSRWGGSQGASPLTLLDPCLVRKNLAGGVNVLILLGCEARKAGQRLLSRRDARSGPPGLKLSRKPHLGLEGVPLRVVRQCFPTQVGMREA